MDEEEEEEEEEESSSWVEDGEDLESVTKVGKLDSTSSKDLKMRKCTPAADDSEDFIKNLREKTVTGKRGRPGTKPHQTDTPETYLAKKRALLSGDPRELKKVIEHQDPTGYFRRAFGKFLERPDPSPKNGHFNDDEKSATAALSSLRHDRSQNYNAASKSGDNIRKCMKKSSLAPVHGSKSTTRERNGLMEGSSSNINNGNKKKTMVSDFAATQIIKNMDDDSYDSHGTSHDADDEDSPSPEPDSTSSS